MDLKSLKWKQGQVNPSGIRPIAYFIHKKDIVAFPALEDDMDVATTVSEYVNYETDFVLADGAFWKTIYSSQGKGSATWETIGEKDCKMFNNKGTLSYPDINSEGRALTKAVVNDNVVIIIPLPVKGRYIVLGNEYYDVECTPTGNTGDAPGSAKGLSIEITVPDTTPLPGYTGELVFEDGVLDCSTGVFTGNVTGVSVSPATVTVAVGGSQQFSASVQPPTAPQGVVWSVTGALHAGTTVSAGGLLSVSASESAGTLTVKATTGTFEGTATVTVI
jgi:hypothetical protein